MTIYLAVLIILAARNIYFKQNGGTLKALPVYLDLVAKVRETYGATENQKK